MDGMTISGAMATKTAIGAITGIGLLHLGRRSAVAQRTRIRSTLRGQALGLRQRNQPFIPSDGPFPRTDELQALHNLISSPPRGPLVVTGAEGVGTSAIVLQALSNCSPPLLLYVNMREQARSAHRPFLWQFVQSSGFYTMPREWVELGLGRSARGGMDSFDQHDMDSCLATMATVLEQEKARRERAEAKDRWWRWGGFIGGGRDRPLPVICLDELHNVESGGENFSIDPPLRKFLQWALFLTDAQLAHVILIARPHVAAALDNLAPFRVHRRRLIVGFSPPEEVVQFLETREGGALSREDAREVAGVLGGQLKDLRLIVQRAQHRGRPAWRATLSELRADSEEVVARQWEELLDAGNSTALSRSARIGAYKRSQRFWVLAGDARCPVLTWPQALANAVSKQGAVRRRELVSAIFGPTGGSAAAEVEGYIEAGLLTYCPPPPGDESSAQGDASEERRREGGRAEGLWVGAASPRLRAALEALVGDPMHVMHQKKAELELEKHEQAQRMEELGARRAEIAAEIASLGSIARSTLVHSDSMEAGLRRQAQRTVEEQLHTAAELRVVRAEYDRMKWKGRWSAGAESDGSKA